MRFYLSATPWHKGLQLAVEIAMRLKPVDAVEVVRCEKCKHRVKPQFGKGYRCGHPTKGMTSVAELKDDDFCPYGERKE